LSWWRIADTEGVNASLLDALAAAVGPGHVLTDPGARGGFERDWSGRWRGEAGAVVRPADTAQVSAVVRACAAAGVPIVTQGGNSGLVGGAVPHGGRPVVVSTSRLDALGPVEAATAQLPAGAGVTLAAAQRAARAAGLDLALDLGARDSATLGGLAANDAGGLRAMRHGTARRQLAGLEAVLADGSVVRSRMTGLVKDTAGYDLGALLVGSEGTLGIICAVRWSLVARRDARAVALVTVSDVAEAVALAGALRPALASLEVCELMDAAGMAVTADYLGVADPADGAPWAVLLECAAASGAGDPLDELAAALDAAGVASRARVAADAAARERLFAIRERHAEALAAGDRVPVKLDVGVPLAGLARFATEVGEVAAAVSPGARVVVFGHLADGNLHVNVLPAQPVAAGAPAEAALERAVLELVAACGGTVSAEHGIGVQKPAYLSLTRSEAEIAAMHAIKRALDPSGLLNPGVALPPR
jgi:FAD/FMN-containing dehydrogenase